MIAAGTRRRPVDLLAVAGPRARRGAVGRAAIVLVALSIVAAGFVTGRGAGTSLALLVSSASNTGNVLTAGRWVTLTGAQYLHNDPTPPTGPTLAATTLGMDGNAPTATILYDYDSNVDPAAGRTIARGGTGAGETNSTRYAVWRSAPVSFATTISGSIGFAIATATPNFATGRSGALALYLRDFNPVNGSWVELANGTKTAGNWQGGSRTWVVASGAFGVTNKTLPAGHQLELKLEVPSSSATGLWIAYDTMSYASSITLP